MRTLVCSYSVIIKLSKQLVNVKGIIIFLLLLNLTVFISVINLTKTSLVDIRQAFSTSIVNSSEFLNTPRDLQDIGFKIESKNNVAEFLNRNYKFLFQNKLLVYSNYTVFSKVRIISSTFSKYGGNGCGSFNDDLKKKINWVSNGGGCCSDHSMVFISLCLINNIEAREVSNMAHTFNEFWDPQRGKWLFIDSEYLLMAKDSSGNYLSTYELFQAQKNRSKFILESFGPENKGAKSVGLKYADARNFQCVLLKMQNDVFAEEYWNKTLILLPKELRQIVLIICGIQKGYHAIDDNSSYIVKMKKLKVICQVFLGIYVFLNFIGVLYFWKFKEV